jgi:hypothetical protein
MYNKANMFKNQLGYFRNLWESMKICEMLERLRYPGSGLRVQVSPFCLPIFADVSIFTRNFYPFSRGKPWSTRRRQTGTGVFYLLFVGRLNSKHFQHLTQINNALSYACQSFQQSIANLNSESCHSLIGLLTPEYLRFIKLQVLPRFTGTCISPVPVNRNRGILTSLLSKTCMSSSVLSDIKIGGEAEFPL